MPLKLLLDQNLLSRQENDFMSFDVEGFDYEVLKSNDWIKYRPKFVLAEILSSSMNEIENSEIGKLILKSGYLVYAKTMNTVFFKSRDTI